MLDLKFIREHADAVRTAISQKRVDLDLDRVLEADRAVVELKKQLQALQEERNANAKLVPKAAADQRASLVARGREIGGQIEALKPELEGAEKQLSDLLWLTPQIPSPDAPIGPDESGNLEVKRWGTPPSFDFQPKDHVALLDLHGWAELERIAAIAGSRSYALKGELALLELAILQFALNALARKGFTPITVPAFVREPALYGTGHFPTGREQVYYLPADDVYLSGTAEVPLNSLHRGEILKESELPLRYAGFSPCFRREAGSAGRDVRGLIRVHQFMKVEQFVLCKNDAAESAHWLRILLENSEQIVQELEIPYRIVDVCTGDMGAGKVRMYDIESWVPSEQKYRETHSCSALHDWQARRADLRYRDEAGKVQFVHTLNNTAIATPRFLVCFLENHQQKDGSVRIPKALQPFLGGRERIGG
jgi:seryl-tRNA synthetase